MRIAPLIVFVLAFAPVLLATPTSRPSDAQPATMKAVRIHEFGGLDKLVYEDAPRPRPADDEILVRVHAAGVNPVDTSIRQGRFRSGDAKLPFIPGSDIAGVVEEIGSKVTRFKKGDAVFAYLSLAHGGGYAQYAIAKESEAAPKPANIPFDEAGGVPLVALTAWQALIDAATLNKGQSVLIHGGSGGVGSIAIQIARSRGAKVYATASGKNQDLLRALGADVAIDYETQRFEEIAKDMDIVLDSVGGDTRARSFDTLKKGGILVSIVGPPDQAAANAKGVRATGILVKPDGGQLAEIGRLIESGEIKPAPTRVLPLSEARKAHELVEPRHTRGKIVLKVD